MDTQVLNKETKEAKAFSIVAVATGAASFLYGIPLAIVALVFASLYQKKVGRFNDMARLGKTFAKITIIINAVVIGLYVTCSIALVILDILFVVFCVVIGVLLLLLVAMFG